MSYTSETTIPNALNILEHYLKTRKQHAHRLHLRASVLTACTGEGLLGPRREEAAGPERAQDTGVVELAHFGGN